VGDARANPDGQGEAEQRRGSGLRVAAMWQRLFVGCAETREQNGGRLATAQVGIEGGADLAAAGVRTHSLREFTTIWALQRSKFAWLLGAGASASAGVPLASSIRDRLLVDRYAAEHQLVRQDLDETDPNQLHRIHAFFDGKNGMPALGSDGDYSAAFDLCLPDASARKALLKGMIDDVRPVFGQRVFGGLIVAGACDLAITTNFDRLIELGVYEAQRAGTDLSLPLVRELNVAGLDSPTRAAVAIQDRRWPLVVKLHGDFRETRLMNTDDELQQQDAALRQFVVDASRQFGLAVSGYSGRDRSVMEMLKQTLSVSNAWPFGLWWFSRPNGALTESVRDLLVHAARQGVAANLVVASSFDETMAALARQLVVDEPMREYFNRLNPKRRTTPSAVPSPSREWPVLRFNALPVIEASAELTRVNLPTGWNRRAVRNAMTPRVDWPVVVSGPGEMLCLGNAEAVSQRLAEAASRDSLPLPGQAATIQIDLLDAHAPHHHQTVLLQAVAHALQQVLPVRMQSGKGGSPTLIVTAPSADETAAFAAARSRLERAYEGSLFGSLGSQYGVNAEGKTRRWAEELRLNFDRRAGKPWLLFTPYTWIQPPARDKDTPITKSEVVDPANQWRAERWAKRRFNEQWAAMIQAWTTLIAPEDSTVLAIPSGDPPDERSTRVLLGRTNAYSRPA
jgi:hypothetical protein